MNLVVVETADAGGLDPSRLCFQIEHLTNHAGFPEQPGVHPWAGCRESFVKGYEHPSREDSVRRDILTTTHGAGNRPFITH